MSAALAMRAWFEAYLAAFNRSDFEGFGAYYAQDVAFHGQAAQLNGRQAVLDFYREVKSYLDEQLELLAFAGDPAKGRIAAEIRTRLVAIRDWPEMPTGAMQRGDVRESTSIIFYDVADGHFTRVRSARLSPSRSRA